MSTFANGYENRKSLTIDYTKVSSFSGIFRMLVLHTDADLKTVANGGKVKMNPLLDIRFEDTSGNKLAHEIVSYEATTGAIQAWVRLPTPPSHTVNTTIYIFFGKNLSAESYQGIRIGYKSADKMVVERNYLGSGVNPGELQPYISNMTDPDGGSITQPNTGYVVGTEDGSTLYTGWLMYSAATTQSRFSMGAPENDHLILVRYDSGTWYYDNNSNANNSFTPVSTDFLIAEVSWNHPTSGREQNYFGTRPAGEELPWIVWADDVLVTDNIGVVSNNFRNVTHLNKVPETTFSEPDVNRFAMNWLSLDSMGSGNLVNAKFGKGIEFDGSNDLLRAKYDVIWHASSVGYISFWFKVDTTGATCCLFSRRTGVNTGDAVSIFLISGALRVDFGPGSQWSTGWSATAGTWYYIVAQTDGATRRLFVNGSQVATQASAVGWSTGGSYHHVQLGASISDATNSGNFFDGIISEFRLYAAARDSGMFTTEYNNQNSPSTFYSVGSNVVPGDAVGQDLSHGHALDGALGLTEHKTLAVQEALQGNTLDAINILQKHQLAGVQNLIHAQALDALGTFVQNSELTVADLLHAHNLEQGIVSLGAVLFPNDMAHTQSLDPVVLVQQHQLTVAELQHAHALDAVATQQQHILVPADLQHVQLLEPVTFTQAHFLAVQDALQGQAVDNVILTQKHTLEVQDALQAHSLDSPFVYTLIPLIVQEMGHIHSLDVTLVQVWKKPKPERGALPGGDIPRIMVVKKDARTQVDSGIRVKPRGAGVSGMSPSIVERKSQPRMK